MRSLTSRAFTQAVAALGLALAFSVPAMFAAERPSAMPAWADDAELLDVTFVDRQLGWAVGQHGVIWHTSDGGTTWRLQHQRFGCRLRKVCFVDDRLGWAVGSEPRPLPSPLQGVVLRTSDGGEHWQIEQRLLLPPLENVTFFDHQQGIACGWPTALYPTGVITTRDGGQSWTALPLESSVTSTAAYFMSERSGLLAQHDGRIRGFDGGRSLVTEKVTDGLRSLRALALTEQGTGLAAGDGGLLLRSGNGGESWSAVSAPVDTDFVDWRAMVSHGQTTWVAGSPGDSVLVTHDDGESWTRYTTEQTLPINALCAVDSECIYAVGPLGTVLNSTDGGQTWQTRRGAGKRAAWLAIYSDPQAMPLELPAKLCATSGYFGSAYFVARRDRVAWPGIERELPLRAAHALDALQMAHMEFSWAFPARERGIKLSRDALLVVWNRLHHGEATEQLRDELTRTIQMWRPDVVFTHSAQSDDPLEQVITRAVLDAVARATQGAENTLPPWEVKKTYGSRMDSSRAAVSLARAEISTALGCTLEQFASIPRRYLPYPGESDQPLVAFDVLASAATEQTGGNLISALQASPASDSRRATIDEQDHTVDTVHRAAQYGRNLKAIVEMANHAVVTPEQILTRIESLIEGIADEEAGELLFTLATQYYQNGNSRMAMESWQLLTSRFPEHPLAAPALYRLLRLRTSGEFAHRFRDSDVLLAGAEASSMLGPVKAVAFEGAVSAAVQPIARPAEPHSPTRQADLIKLVASTATRLEQADAALYSDPQARFPLAMFQQRSIGAEVGRRHFTWIANMRSTSVWCANAAAELWQADPSSECPKPQFVCRRIDRKPYLDGQLDDDVWQTIKPVALKSPYRDDAEWPAYVLAAHDGEYLYLAGRVHSLEPPPQIPELPAARDADLSRYDRVEIYLDIDRDYSTYYRFQIDERGSASDACVDDLTWNPRWYVAHSADEEGWSFEAAIALADLCESASLGGTSWAVGLQRVAPRQGYQAATFPAAPLCQPEGFGLMRFE